MEKYLNFDNGHQSIPKILFLKSGEKYSESEEMKSISNQTYPRQ